MLQSKVEFELKLTGPAADVLQVRKFAGLSDMAVGAQDWARLTTVYYDTSDFALAAAGVSLRIRDEGGVKTLTGKIASPDSGAFARREAERVLSDGDDEFTVGVSEIDAEIAKAFRELRIIARTTTDRWSAIVAETGTLVEIAAEIGKAENLVGVAMTTAIAEVEIELLKGPPAGVFSIARRLIAASEGRLRLTTMSKLERALTGEIRRPPVRAAHLAPPAGAHAVDLIGLSLRPIAMQIIEASACVCSSCDEAAIKRLRVALRRLRALERLFRKSVEDGALASLAECARRYSAEAGVVRDLDVFISKRTRLEGASSLYAKAQSERAAAAFGLAETLSGVDFGLFTIDLLEAALTEPHRRGLKKNLASDAAAFAANCLEKRWARLRTEGERLSGGDPSQRHRFRIKLKKFRYAAQFFRGLFDGPSRKPFFSAMSRLQDRLGAENDAATAIGIADKLGSASGADTARSAGFIAGYASAEAAMAASIADAEWRNLESLPPFWRMPLF